MTLYWLILYNETAALLKENRFILAVSLYCTYQFSQYSERKWLVISMLSILKMYLICIKQRTLQQMHRNLSLQLLFLSLPTIITQVPDLIILHFNIKITCCLVSSAYFLFPQSLPHFPCRRIFLFHCSDYVSVRCTNLQCLPKL